MRQLFKILVTILFLCTITVFGVSNIDSLLFQLKNEPDTAKIHALNNYCWKYRSDNPALAIAAGKKALELCEKNANLRLAARTLNLLGVANRSLGKSDSSIYFLNKALEAATKANNRTEMAFAENNLGGSFRIKAYYTIAFKHVSKALNLFDELKDSSGMGYALINIGFIYQGQKNYSKALEYFTRCYELRNNLHDREGVLVVKNEIARTYMDLGKPYEAEKIFNDLLHEYEKLRDNSGYARACAGLGELYILLNRLDLSKKYLTKSYNLAVASGNTMNTIKSGQFLGIVHAKQHNFTEAERLIKHSVALAESSKDYALISNCYKIYAEYLQLSGQYQLALSYFARYSDLKDSITAKDNISGVSEMEAYYQNEVARRKNEMLQKNLETEENFRWLYIAIAITLLALSASLGWRYATEKRAHKAEEELRKSEAKYIRIFTNAYIGIFQAEPNGTFLQANPAMAQLFGIESPEQFLKTFTRFNLLPHLPDSTQWEQMISVQEQEKWRTSECRFTTNYQTELIALIHCRNEYNEDGSIKYIEGFLEDITQRALAEQERELYAINLKKLNASKDKFFSIISHDLRGPYQGFLGMTRILAESPESFSHDRLKQIGSALHKSAENQFRLLTDLLSWSRMQTGSFKLAPELLELASEINNAILPFELTAKNKGVIIDNLVHPDIHFVADREMFQLLIRNLLSNSIKFTYAGGFVKFTADASDDAVAISVADSGIGIPQEALDKLFRIDDKYTTTGTDLEEGTGLGLPLCDEIVKKHNGTLQVESKVNTGTIFKIRLPKQPLTEES